MYIIVLLKVVFTVLGENLVTVFYLKSSKIIVYVKD